MTKCLISIQARMDVGPNVILDLGLVCVEEDIVPSLYLSPLGLYFGLAWHGRSASNKAAEQQQQQLFIH